MGLALDFGTTRFRSLRWERGELVGRSVPATFALLKDEPSARELFQRAGLPFAHGDGELALIGDESVRYASVFKAIRHRLLSDGLVPNDDPFAREILLSLVDSIIPDAVEVGACCRIVFSAGTMTDRDSRAFFSRLVASRGFQSEVISAGHALMLGYRSGDHASGDHPSGLGLVLGAGGTSLSLVHQGKELLQISDPRGLDWIDKELATRHGEVIFDEQGEKYLNVEKTRARREALSDSVAESWDTFSRDVLKLYEQLLQDLFEQFAEKLRDARLGPYALEAPVVCGGGGANLSGLEALWDELVDDIDLPVPLGSFTCVGEDEFLIAQGALAHIEAHMETPTALRRAA